MLLLVRFQLINGSRFLHWNQQRMRKIVKNNDKWIDWIAIERLIMTHEKWRKKRKIVNESGESMICESKSSLAIYDSSLDNDNDVLYNEIMIRK